MPDELAGERVDLHGIQRAKQRPKATDQRIQIQRGFGVIHADRRSRVEALDSARPLLQLQIAITDEVLLADQCTGAVGEHHGVLGGELDIHDGVWPYRNALDLAHFHAGDAHEVTGLQSGDIGEFCVVRVSRLGIATVRTP